MKRRLRILATVRPPDTCRESEGSSECSCRVSGRSAPRLPVPITSPRSTGPGAAGHAGERRGQVLARAGPSGVLPGPGGGRAAFPSFRRAQPDEALSPNTSWGFSASFQGPALPRLPFLSPFKNFMLPPKVLQLLPHKKGGI